MLQGTDEKLAKRAREIVNNLQPERVLQKDLCSYHWIACSNVHQESPIEEEAKW